MLAPGHGENRSIPDFGWYGSEELVQPVGTLNHVALDLTGRTLGAGADLGGSTGRATDVLLYELYPSGCLDAPTHGLGVACQVRQDVADSPAGQRRGLADVRVGEPSGDVAQPLVCTRALVDVRLGDRHAPRLWPGPAVGPEDGQFAAEATFTGADADSTVTAYARRSEAVGRRVGD